MNFSLNGAVKDICYFIPVGATQLNLDAITPAKTIHYWEASIKDIGAPITESFQYEADNVNDYIAITIHYRNSLGGLDTFRVRGSVEKRLQYSYTEIEKTIEPDYFNGDFFSPQKTIVNNIEQLVYTGDIGHMRREELDRLRDAHMIREAWWEINKKWVPVNIITKDFSLVKTEDFRFHMPIEFTLGYNGSEYYTPDSVDLGDGVFTDNVCLAMLSPLAIDNIDLSGADAVVDFTGTEVDPQLASVQFRYQVTKISDGSTVIPWTTAAYADLPISIHLPKNDIYKLEAQSICANNVFGGKSSVQINTNPIGGGGGGGGTNSSIQNFTSNDGAFVLKRNGVPIQADFIGASGIFQFNEADQVNVTYDLLPPFTPALAQLISNGVTYNGVILGGLIKFFHVDVTGGMIINLY
jgi:hypothetical protein